jgi:hypothetical protein
MIPIYIGSDQRQAPAERVLEYSIRKHTDAEVEIHWMRYGDPGFDDWNLGRPPGKLKAGKGWGTNFSCFRFAIPELAGFQGYAIYLDSDMVVTGDIADLYSYQVKGKWNGTSPKFTDVSVVDCEGLKGVLPPLEQLKTEGHSLSHYRRMLWAAERYTHTIPIDEWNCRDRVPGSCKLLHFTNMGTQPWTPHPEAFAYRPHPCKQAVDLWQGLEKESRGFQITGAASE